LGSGGNLVHTRPSCLLIARSWVIMLRIKLEGAEPFVESLLSVSESVIG